MAGMKIRIRDKILIEVGYVVKAKVKWYGGGYAYQYLWKENKAETEYKESCSDPKVSKVKKDEEETNKQHNRDQNMKISGG